MSLFALDTDTLTLYREGHPTVTARLLDRPVQEICTTVITVEEQLSGWYTLIRRVRGPSALAMAYDQLAETVELCAGMTILRFSELAITKFEELKKLKLGVGGMDLRIASTALVHGATVVTRNTGDFIRIPGLSVVDWSKSP